MTKKIIRTYLRFSLLFILGQSFFFATYQIFLKNHGLSLLEINLINLCFMASNFLLEVPTGAIADIFGRRKSVILGCLILSLSFLIYFLSTNFWLFALAEIIGALGATCLSGALEAWMVDSLKFHGYVDDLEKIYEKEGSYRLVGVIIGSLSGAYFGNIDLALPWLMSAIGMALVALFGALKLQESYFEPQALKWNLGVIKATAKDSIIYGLKHKGIFYAISFGAILTLSFQGFNMQWPIVFNDFGLSIQSLGFIFNGIAVAIFLGNKLSKIIRQKIKNEKEAMILSQSITALGMMLAASMIGFYPVLAGFMIHEIGRGAFRPLKQAYLNRRIETDNKRATILSFDSMVSQLGSGLGLLFSGFLANYFSISVSWLSSAIVLVIGMITFQKLKNGD
jgi:MFS family permease